MNIFRILLFVAFSAFIASCSQQEKFKISGEIANGKGKQIYLQQLNLDGTVILDSAELKSNGTFKFALDKLEYPTFLLLKLSENNFITLLGDTTENIEIMADADNLSNSYTVKNSMGSAYVRTLYRKFETTKERVDSLANVYKSIESQDVKAKENIKTEISKVIEDQKDFTFDFIMTNPRSFASYYAIFQRYDNGTLMLDPYLKRDMNMFGAVATSLDLLYPESPRVKQLKNFVLGIKQEQKKEELTQKLLASNSIVNGYPEIDEKDINGKSVKLSSLNGKMILLSFWASWDQKSRKENQNLVKVYKKYKSKGFEVYQVSLDKSKILWEQAIEEDKLPWINVSDLQYTKSYPASLYNVQQLPANYLISKDGEIIGKDLFGRILDEKLHDLLN